MTRKWYLIVTACILLTGMTHSGSALTPESREITMLVVPARYSVLQVAFDVADHYRTVLLSYQGDARSEWPLLHAWNGREWVYVSVDDYRDGRFLQRMPTRTVLVGDEDQLPPLLLSSTDWCPMVMSIPSIDTATLVNSLGKVYSFPPEQWRWFAARYNLTLLELNREDRRRSWYDGPYIPEREEDSSIPSVYLDPEEVRFEQTDVVADEPEALFEQNAAPVETTEEPLSAEEEYESAEPELEDVQPSDRNPMPAPPMREPEGWEERAVAEPPQDIE
jgi:hypothetical protein